MIRASDWFTIQIPPPCVAGETPPVMFPAMMLLRNVGVPAANNATPPPDPAFVAVLLVMIFPIICADPLPPIQIPAPPPPEHAKSLLLVMVLPRISADENSTASPPPLHPLLFWMMLLVMVG